MFEEQADKTLMVDDHHKLEDLFDSSVIYVKALSPEGFLVFANAAELAYSGFAKEEYLGRHFADFAVSVEQAMALLSILQSGNPLQDQELLFRKKGGEIRHLLVSSMTKIDNAGVKRHYIFCRDITSFKRTQELLDYLNRSGEELASALDTDSALNKVSNLIVPRFANWFTIDVLSGQNIIGLKVKHADAAQVKWAEEYRKNNPNDISDTSSALGIVLTTGNPVFVPEITDEMLTEGIKEPERLALFRSMNLRSVIIVPMYVGLDIKGAVTFISTDENRTYDERDLQFAKDFANRVALTLENARLYESANKELAQRIEAEKMKDEFISIASHELKTPLTSIKAYVQLMQKTLSREDRSFGFLMKTNEHIVRLERLIADLLDVSKIEAGKIAYNAADFNFQDLLLECIEGARHISQQHEIRLEASANVMINGDKLRLEQVVNNFLSNAIKYSPERTPVIVRSEIVQDNLVVSIQDFGIGIERENLGSLFDRFYRVDNTAMKFQGLGLGLYISAEILKRHNGSFWIESEPGKGSKFFFLLPLKNQATGHASTDNQSFYRNKHITITVNEKCWLEACWTGFQNYASIEDGGLAMHKLVKANKCSKVLNDNSLVEGNWSEAADWGAEVWFPMMEQAGTRYFAWIYSPSTFSQLSAEKSVEMMQGGIITRLFSNKEEAVEWLDSV